MAQTRSSTHVCAVPLKVSKKYKAKVVTIGRYESNQKSDKWSMMRLIEWQKGKMAERQHGGGQRDKA